MKRAQGVLAVAAWVAGAFPAWAQEAQSFPANLSRDVLVPWLQRETDVQPDRVIAVTPQAVTSIVSTFPAGAGEGPRLVIRAEALNADTASRTGALSWHVSLTADCPGHRVRLGETTGYPNRNLLGQRKSLREADADWRAPDAGTALDFAWRAACDPQFTGPFQGVRVKQAQADVPLQTSPVPVTQEAPPPQPSAQQETPAPVAEASPAPAAQPPEPVVAPPVAARPGAFVAQVGAGASDAEARTLLGGLQPSLGGRSSWVERAVVGGKTWHRAIVGDFGSAGEAARFCADLKAAGRACFVRAGKPAR